MKKVIGTYKVMCGANEEGHVTLCPECAKRSAKERFTNHLESMGRAGAEATCDDCGAEQK